MKFVLPLALLGPMALMTFPAAAQQTDPPAQTAPVAAAASPQAEASPAPQPSVKPAKTKGKKVEYTGPNTIVEVPPTPMLDDQGQQRLDTDGKPMFNPPIKQQRDKHGHPLFDDHGKPVMQTATELGYDEKGKKLHAPKEKKVKMTPLSISHGTLTVDGMTGKAALNYDIADLKYIYIFAPGVGVAIVSKEPFPGGTEQKKAFNDSTLKVLVEGHTLEIASDKRLLSKGTEPAYVMLDRQFALPSRFPAVGYGSTRKAPYVWPGAKPNEQIAGVDAPPPPSDLLPVQLQKPCPKGTMRKASVQPAAGQGAAAQPCVPISAPAVQNSVPKLEPGTADSAKK